MLYSNLLEEILDAPELYVGASSLNTIKTFLDGYIFAHKERDEFASDPLYAGFQQWIEQRFELPITRHWANIITFFSSNDKTACDSAKELWYIYKAEFNQSHARSVATPEANC